MKLIYCSSLSYPSPFANRIQTLSTAEALGAVLGDDFCFAASNVRNAQELYTHRLINFSVKTSFLLAWKQMRYIKKYGYRAVFCREEHLLFFLMVYDRFLFRTGAAFFYEAHDVEQYPGFGLRYVLTHAHGIVATATAICEHLPYVRPGACLVVRNGVNLERFAAPVAKSEARRLFGLPVDVPIALYAGTVNVHAWKGTDIFIQSHAALSSGSQHVLYVLAGGSPSVVEELSGAHNPAHIRFLPHLGHEALAKLMQAADVLVLPNTGGEDVSARYTSPVKLFEYMASGVPVVASDLPSIREIVDESMVRFAEPGKPASLATAITAAIADVPGSTERATRARSEVAQYTWAERAKCILDFIAK